LDAAIEALTKHYSAFPYPSRKREDDNVIASSFLVQISAKLFGGKFDSVWKQPDLRILDAGGGTGDASITLARQLDKINTKARIIHLDLSKNGQKIAKERAEYWEVGYMIEFVCGSMLDEDVSAGLGKFDFIQSHGVLHHLRRPQEGLQALKSMLKPGGGMGIMVYGQYGRTGIYDVQRMARMLHPPDIFSEEERVSSLQALLRSLPRTNRLKRNGLWQGVQSEVSDDAGAYDLFLHSQDRAYTVQELYQWVEEECGLKIVGFNHEGFYDPLLWLQDPSVELTEAIEKLDEVQKHVSYLVSHISYLISYISYLISHTAYLLAYISCEAYEAGDTGAFRHKSIQALLSFFIRKTAINIMVF
jgi:SAM-dependent methyltransferase